MPGKTRSGSTSDSGKSPRSDGGKLKNGENPTNPQHEVASPLKPAIRRLSVKLEKIKVEPEMLPLGAGGETEKLCRNRLMVQVSDDESVEQIEEYFYGPKRNMVCVANWVNCAAGPSGRCNKITTKICPATNFTNLDIWSKIKAAFVVTRYVLSVRNCTWCQKWTWTL